MAGEVQLLVAAVKWHVEVIVNVAGLITATAAAVTSVIALRRSAQAIRIGRSAVRSLRQNEPQGRARSRDEREE